MWHLSRAPFCTLVHASPATSSRLRSSYQFRSNTLRALSHDGGCQATGAGAASAVLLLAAAAVSTGQHSYGSTTLICWCMVHAHSHSQNCHYNVLATHTLTYNKSAPPHTQCLRPTFDAFACNNHPAASNGFASRQHKPIEKHPQHRQ